MVVALADGGNNLAPNEQQSHNQLAPRPPLPVASLVSQPHPPEPISFVEQLEGPIRSLPYAAYACTLAALLLGLLGLSGWGSTLAIVSIAVSSYLLRKNWEIKDSRLPLSLLLGNALLAWLLFMIEIMQVYPWLRDLPTILTGKPA